MNLESLESKDTRERKGTKEHQEKLELRGYQAQVDQGESLEY